MNEIAIRVENLGKLYRIGLAKERNKTFREAVTDMIAAPWQYMKKAFRKQPVTEVEKSDYLWALRNVSFDVKRGEVVGIIGRNGAGKSTLLKILSRITEPTEGRIVLCGRVGSLLEVGTGFHSELTGEENIYLSGTILGMSSNEISRKFGEIVAFAELEKFIHTPVKHYSTGMYMRLAFAVAAHLEPEILLVDEVLAVGDAQFQKKCIGKMGDVAKDGRTVLFVSHNMPAVQRMCSSALLLNEGRIVSRGEVAAVTEQYLSFGASTSLSWRQDSMIDKDAYFLGITLQDKEGNPLSYVSTATTLRIALDFVLINKINNLMISIGLLDGQAEQIFGSASQDSGLTPPELPGRYRIYITLPGEIFMARKYGIRATLWVPERGVIDNVENIWFSVQASASLATNTSGGRLGVLAIKCNWSLEP